MAATRTIPGDILSSSLAATARRRRLSMPRSGRCNPCRAASSPGQRQASSTSQSGGRVKPSSSRPSKNAGAMTNDDAQPSLQAVLFDYGDTLAHFGPIDDALPVAYEQIRQKLL